MEYGQERMTKEHPGTGKTHDLANLLPFFRGIAVYFALRTSRFKGIKSTFFNFFVCIFQKQSTIPTQITFSLMMSMTIQDE
jgi:hypothetical protein